MRAWSRFVPVITGLAMINAVLVAGRAADARVRSGAGDESGARLRERLRALRTDLHDVPLPVIIDAWSGHAVRPWQGECREQLAVIAADVLASINRDGITAARANEAGNAVEEHVLTALAMHGLRPGRPAGPSGRARSAGYPDLEAFAPAGDAAFYIEVKTYSAATEDSSQRTFYLSPSEDFKVTRDAFHLLIAIELVRGKGNSGAGMYHAVRARWLDLSRLTCDLKHEFNASNRDLYEDEGGLIVIERDAARAPHEGAPPGGAR